MGRGKQLFAYPMDWLFPNLSQPNKTNMAFFVSHLVHKKKKTKKKTAVWNCSSHPQNSPPPWRLKGSIIILIWTIAFISSGCVEVGERWISYFSLCHQKWVCGAGASWKSGTCLFPSGVFVGRGGREVRTGCVHPSSLLLLYPGFPNILEKFVISFFFFYHVFDGTSSSPIKIPYLDWGKMSLLYLRSLLYIP